MQSVHSHLKHPTTAPHTHITHPPHPPPAPKPTRSHAAAGVQGAALTLPLTVAGPNIPTSVHARFPHLYGCTHLAIPAELLERVGGWEGV